MPELWSAYKINLDVLNSRLNRRPGGQGAPEAIDPAIDTLLADGPGAERTFSRHYEAEQRLALLMSDAEIKADAVRRFGKAAQVGVPTVAALATAFNAAASTGASSRWRRGGFTGWATR